MICLSIKDENYDFSSIPSYVEYIELRADLNYYSITHLQELLEFPYKFIIKVDPRHEDYLQQIIFLQPDFIDLDLKYIQRLNKETLDNLLDSLIISHHFENSTPSVSELKNKLKEIEIYEPALIKIISYSHSEEDNIKIMSLYEDAVASELLVFAMGETGKPTRIKAIELGSPWIYVAPDMLSKSAPGQFTLAEAKEIIKPLFLKNRALFGVAGNPIEHSLSPQLFNSIFHDLGYHYTRIESSSIDDVIEIAKEAGFKGLNITHPLKKAAFERADLVDINEIELEAANTLLIDSDLIIANNTDVYGAEWLELELKDSSRTLILGSGATAELILHECENNFDIYSRNKASAELLAQKYGASVTDNPDIDNYDVLINCLPRGVKLPFDIFGYEGKIYDVNYNNSVVENEAKKYDVPYIDGLDWLLTQAKASFDLFTGITPLYSQLDDAVENYKPKKNSIIIGFMGSGKTTYAHKLAKEQGYIYIDIDEYIEHKLNNSIKDIFSEQGEAAFRKIESEALMDIFDIVHFSDDKYVISTGGGIIENENNVEILKTLGEIVWLYLPLDECLKRAGGINRPLLKLPFEEIEARYNSRLRKYAFASDLIIYNR